MNVVIAGASGFVGKNLLLRLVKEPEIKVSSLGRSLTPPCDLFSLLDVEKALENQDQAIYLVHSMLPSSQLSQGHFADYDLILADNFARACRKNNIKRIIYLGGIIPPTLQEPKLLSRHLESRLEVEEIFKSYGIPLLTLRSGLVMGKEGSSFQMLLRLVQRLPAMICPAWTKKETSPIHVRDVAESIAWALRNPTLEGTFDLANGESISYLGMLQKCSEKMKKRRRFFDVPFFSPKLSKLWVRTITGAPKNLVYPLIDSLQHDMSPDPKKILRIPNWHYTVFSECLDEIIEDFKNGKASLPRPKAYTLAPNQFHVVQSVQRHMLPQGKNALWAIQEYIRWLNSRIGLLISILAADETINFYIKGTKIQLLELRRSSERSSNDRELFYNTGGLLSNESKRGRLEFRVTHNRKFLITAIHDYRPSLPWYLYKFSQALVHSRVMKQFGKHLISTKYGY